MIQRLAFYFFLLLAGFVVLGAPRAQAADDLQTVLTPPDITIADQKIATAELNAFYAARAYKPAWNFAGKENAKAFDGFLDSLQKLVDYHGLPPQDYPLDAMRKLAASDDEADKQRLELLVTDSLLTLGHALHGDRIDFDDIYDGWTFHRDAADIPALLAAAVSANKLDNFIDTLTPKNPAYEALAKALIHYRDLEKRGGWHPIDSGTTIRPNDKNPRVGQLRARLIAEDYLPPATPPPEQAELYDTDLQNAVKAYQLRNGLEADGNVGAQSIEMMNIPAQTRIGQIAANMERWRHIPESFPPDRYVLVNIPDVSVTIVENKNAIYHGPVIVGRDDRRTPFIDSVIRSMIVNPVWHVPAKIARKDILPKLQKDAHYLEKLGFTIADRPDDPYGETIDWRRTSERQFNYQLRQAPGDQNSLGQLKFDFNNPYSVYMHGTPHQELFKKNVRNLSSGCIRLRDPLAVAEILLAGTPGPDHKPWDSGSIQAEIAKGQTRWVGLHDPIPIYVVYWTIFNDEANHVNFRIDPYGYDAMLIDKMNDAAP